MKYFQVGDRVMTAKQVRAGMHEDGPVVCEASLPGIIIEIQRKEWDGVQVELESGQIWWFKPGQLQCTDT